MAYIGIDADRARVLAGLMGDAAARSDEVRQDIISALYTTDLISSAALHLTRIQSTLDTLGNTMTQRADEAATPVPTQFRLDWMAGTVLDDMLPPAEPGSSIPGLTVSLDTPLTGVESDLPTLGRVQIPAEYLPVPVPLADGASKVQDILNLGGRDPRGFYPDTLPPPQPTYLKPDPESGTLPTPERSPVVSFQGVTTAEDPALGSGGTVYRAEQYNTRVDVGVASLTTGPLLGVARIRPDGTAPPSYLPTFGSDLQPGESFQIWAQNGGTGSVAAPFIRADGSILNGRMVEVARDGNTLNLTVFPADGSYMYGLGPDFKVVSAATDTSHTTMTGVMYQFPLNQPNMVDLAFQALSDGGLTQNAAHALVNESVKQVSDSYDALGQEFPNSLVTVDQREVWRTYQNSDGTVDQTVTGTISYPGVQVTYSYPAQGGQATAAPTDARVAYDDPPAGQLIPTNLTSVTPLGPVPVDGWLQLSISPDGRDYYGASYVGSVRAETSPGAYGQVPVAVTDEQAAALSGLSDGQLLGQNLSLANKLGIYTDGVDPASEGNLLIGASHAFQRVDIGAADSPVPWMPTVDRTPPPGVTVVDQPAPPVPALDPTVPALMSVPPPVPSYDIDWNTDTDLGGDFDFDE